MKKGSKLFRDNDYYIFLNTRFKVSILKERLLAFSSIEKINKESIDGKLYYSVSGDYFVETFQNNNEILIRKYSLDFDDLTFVLETFYEKDEKRFFNWMNEFYFKKVEEVDKEKIQEVSNSILKKWIYVSQYEDSIRNIPSSS